MNSLWLVYKLLCRLRKVTLGKTILRLLVRWICMCRVRGVRRIRWTRSLWSRSRMNRCTSGL